MFICSPNASTVSSHPAVKGTTRLEASSKFSKIELREYCRRSTVTASTNAESINAMQPSIEVVTHANLAPSIAGVIEGMHFATLGKARVSARMYLSLQILHPANDDDVVEDVSRIASIPGVARIFLDYAPKLLNYYAQSMIQSGHRYGMLTNRPIVMQK